MQATTAVLPEPPFSMPWHWSTGRQHEGAASDSSRSCIPLVTRASLHPPKYPNPGSGLGKSQKLLISFQEALQEAVMQVLVHLAEVP